MTGCSNSDVARVTVDTQLNGEELRQFLLNPERLLRINSLLEFRDWRAEPAESVYRMNVLNLSNDQVLDTLLFVDERHDGLHIRYSRGLKSSTTLRITSGETGLQVEITDDYSGLPEPERQVRLEEVDRSLVQWGHDLHLYMKVWKRWSWFAPWRWYTTYVWQNMKPSARRISSWLIWLTALEFATFLIVFSIFWLESQPT